MKPNTNILTYFVLCSTLFFWVDVETAHTQGSETYRHITTGDGLSSGTVYKLLQDRHGFIWIGTNAGLDKYDGYTVTNFRHDSSVQTSIRSGPVRAIVEDKEGTVWVGSNGLSVLNPANNNHFRQIRVPGDIPEIRLINDLKTGRDDGVWVATVDGLYHFPNQDIQRDTLEVAFQVFSSATGTPEEVRSVADGNGPYLWVATRRQIRKFNTETLEIDHIPEFRNDVRDVLASGINTVLEDTNGTLWIGTENGLVAWHRGNEMPQIVNVIGNSRVNISRRPVRSVSQSGLDSVWITTATNGAMLFNTATNLVKTYRNNPSDRNSIAEDNVQHVFTDTEGNYWFGYQNEGISFMYAESWSYELKKAADEHSSSHPANVIHTVKEDVNGDLWMATHNGLVLHPADGSRSQSFFLNPFNPLMVVKNEFLDFVLEEERIYIITHDRDLLEFNKQERRFDFLRVPYPVSQFDNITADDQHIYVGSATDGLFVVEKVTKDVHHYPNLQNDSSYVSRLGMYPAVDLDGTVYIQVVDALTPYASWKIYRYDPAFKSFQDTGLQSPNGITNFRPLQLSETEPGVLWGVFNVGILKQNIQTGENKFFFQTYMGSVSNTQPGILADREGYLWAGTSRGIMRLNPDTEVVEFFEADPVRKPDFFAEPMQRKDGEIVFAGNGGYIRFNPDELSQDDMIQSVKITELWTSTELYNTLYSQQTDYILAHDDNNISLSYIGLNYKDPVFTRYRYRLSGYDENWNYVESLRRVFFANLPPGEYIFQVQAAQQFGGYTSDIAELGITILPPWWRTIPAYIAFFLLFVLGVYFIDKFQKKRVLGKERERTREKELAQAKEIEKAYEHLKAAQEQLVQQEKLASLGQLTAGIAHEIKNPLNFVNNFSDLSIELIDEVKEEVARIKQNTGSGNGKPENGKDYELISELLEDVEANLKKIFEHGSRADNIVKSMLQHSRGGSNEMEEVDLNGIIKEYVNLSFHGMRANPNPINVDIQLDLDENSGKVSFVVEDFSRVILNICNNAFDAMREKVYATKNSGEIYVPELLVRTRKNTDNVTIEITDNGPGIPDAIKNKVLQPFFTTKKGTQGTGLGLSITNDIIKAHGGFLDIHTSEEHGTTFKITIPTKN